MNRIPYTAGYVVAMIAGIILSVLFIRIGMGAWGLVLGQFIAQVFYNNWKWPSYVMKELNMSYFPALISGFRWLLLSIAARSTNFFEAWRR